MPLDGPFICGATFPFSRTAIVLGSGGLPFPPLSLFSTPTPARLQERGKNTALTQRAATFMDTQHPNLFEYTQQRASPLSHEGW
jgi:hypothetical protein